MTAKLPRRKTIDTRPDMAVILCRVARDQRLNVQQQRCISTTPIDLWAAVSDISKAFTETVVPVWKQAVDAWTQVFAFIAPILSGDEMRVQHDGLPGMASRCWADVWSGALSDYRVCNGEIDESSDLGVCTTHLQAMKPMAC